MRRVWESLHVNAGVCAPVRIRMDGTQVSVNLGVNPRACLWEWAGLNACDESARVCVPV